MRPTNALAAALLALGLGCSAPSVTTADDAQAPEFPYTAAENADGARFVWFIYTQAGYPYEYLGADRLPQSPAFGVVASPSPIPGDVAWWKEFVAIGGEGPRDEHGRHGAPVLYTAGGVKSLAELEARFGRVRWYRYEAARQASNAK